MATNTDIMNADNRCNNCQFYDTTYIVYQKFGQCLKITDKHQASVINNDVEIMPSQLARMEQGEVCNVEFLVTPDFGCVEYKGILDGD